MTEGSLEILITAATIFITATVANYLWHRLVQEKAMSVTTMIVAITIVILATGSVLLVATELDMLYSDIQGFTFMLLATVVAPLIQVGAMRLGKSHRRRPNKPPQ